MQRYVQKQIWKKSSEKKTDYDVFLCDSCLSVTLSRTKHSGIRTHELVEKYFIKQQSKNIMKPGMFNTQKTTSKHSHKNFEAYWRRSGSLMNNNVFFRQFILNYYNHHCKSLLVWKYHRRQRTQHRRSWVHNIIRRRTLLLAMILYIILYFIHIISIL